MTGTFGTARQKTAVITGTSSGFGLLTSIALAKEGFRVAATMRDPGKQGELFRLAEKEGVRDSIEVFRLDVTAPEEEIVKVIRDIGDKFGSIDVLVNNAGYAEGGFVEEVPLEAWRKQFDTNFFGTVAVTRAVLPFMRQQRSGTIINVSSVSGLIGFPALGPYVSSKFALEGFSESLRLEMRPYGIHVVLVEPGSYKTAIWEKGMAKMENAPTSPYGRAKKAIVKNVEKIATHAQDPAEVAELIASIVRSPHPSLRYPVGKGIRTTVLLKRLLPWSWIEKTAFRRLEKKIVDTDERRQV